MDMPELDLPTVHSVISKTIINKERTASLDQLRQAVAMVCTQQNLALQLVRSWAAWWRTMRGCSTTSREPTVATSENSRSATATTKATCAGGLLPAASQIAY